MRANDATFPHTAHTWFFTFSEKNSKAAQPRKILKAFNFVTMRHSACKINEEAAAPANAREKISDLKWTRAPSVPHVYIYII